MKVLSLFDGISCGRLALERAGIPVEKYYASEIDKYAIQISQKNYPDNIALGDVTKWRLWDIDWSSIDLLIGGSPCQTFSNAGTRTGFDGKSGLFYTYLEILNHLKAINPNIKFLLENVKMKSEWRDEITRCMGVEPVLINSALVSAQQRNRYYWCNWQVEQPQDKHIVLKDILLSGESYREKANCLTASYSKAVFDHDYQKHQRTMVAVNLKTYCRDFGTKGKIMTVEDEKTQCLTSSMGTGGGNVPVVAEPIKIPEATKKGYAEIQQGQCFDLSQPNSKTRRGRAMIDKSNCLTCQNEFYQYIEPIRVGHFGNGSQGQRIYSVRGKSICLSSAEGGGNQVWVKIDLPDGEYLVRKLSPVECERLQTLTSKKNNYIIEVCLENQKNYVNVENQNLKKLNAVGNVEKIKKNEPVLFVEKNLNVKNLSISDAVLPNVQVSIGENQLVIRYQNTVLLDASFVEISNKFPHLKAIENFARVFVLINTILDQTTLNGKEEQPQNEINLTQVKNGNIVVKLYGNEIKQLADYVEKNMTIIQKLLNATILFPIDIKNIEQIQKILFCYVVNVIYLFIPEEIQNNCILNISTDLGWTFGVSNTQRYKQIGNGWTVDVIAHIFSSMNQPKEEQLDLLDIC